MTRALLLPSLVALLAFAGACSDAAPTAHEEVAAELRALRLLLAQQPRASMSAEDGAVAAALLPLREGMQALATAQREQAARQLALAQELQRWQQLVSAAVGAGKQDELQTLAQRLQALEQQLREQDERHREVEALVQRALDQTGDRLEEFLQRLQARPTGGSSAPAGTPSAPAAPGDGAPAPDRRVGQARAAGAPERWWWLLVTGLGAAIAFVFLRRSRREALYTAPRAEPAPTADPGAREIWAAAALLGEAVDRLRANDASRARADLPADDDVVVVDDPEPRARPGPPAETVPCGSPAGEARVLALLAADVRVLRRPPPSAEGPAGARAVRFHLLPDLPAGERSGLLAALRRAAR
jgi:hypothetical protein